MHLIHDPNEPPAAETSFGEFLKLDIRVGTVRTCVPFEGARNPSFVLTIDFGAGVGVRKSAAQITEYYTPEGLIGRRVMAVVNFPPRQIGRMRSEVLVLGFPDADGAIVLAGPDAAVPDGARLA
ncbi:tRNA-binding protein [Sphingomonas prati]|uniref:tRNA-binding protein n=1 Tax=Sphingomonas prati TaxID=1843237 RepID=A0A7W9EZY1_9SPHN|nr:tRNA-binding protein [Sphingomonas prati]MBB5727638.1 tRNA-binding protein [Sphingomonas prati]GGE79611.1 tRNA-binding protein [Sphingomonas prati]